MEAEGNDDFCVGEVNRVKVGVVIYGIYVPLQREGSHVVGEPGTCGAEQGI